MSGFPSFLWETSLTCAVGAQWKPFFPLWTSFLRLRRVSRYSSLLFFPLTALSHVHTVWFSHHIFNMITGFYMNIYTCMFVWLLSWLNSLWNWLVYGFVLGVFRKEPEKHFWAVLLCTKGSSSPHCTSLWPRGQAGGLLEMNCQYIYLFCSTFKCSPMNV